MDLETFFTTVYVVVDDWYKQEIAHLKPTLGAPARMSDSEVLTVAVVGQWRVGVPWQSERGLVRYIHSHGREMFPTMLQASAFNQRVRHLYGVLVSLQQAVANWLGQGQALYECVDSFPLVAGSLGQYSREPGHWLYTARIGHGPGGWFWGDRWLVSVTDNGIVTGWLVGAANINDRWLMQAFLSHRAGTPELSQPPRRARDAKRQHSSPPVGFMDGGRACGVASQRPYLADGNFSGQRWHCHWQQHYQAQVIAVPPDNSQRPWSRPWKRWLRQHRQPIETVFARLQQVFAVKHLHVHSRWGQLTKLAAITAAYHLGLWMNRLLDRPWGALATLLC